MTGINKDLENTVHEIQQKESKRNRSRVNEILGFVERCYGELQQVEENF